MMKNAKGFTLVETLVALVITGLVSYLVFSTLQMATSSSQRLNDHMSNYYALKRAKDWFRLSVEGILVQNNYQPHFEGNSLSFQAYSSYSITRALPALTRITWSIRQVNETTVLSFTEGQAGETIDVYSWPQGNGPLKFQYIDQNMRLHDEWSRNESLFAAPEAIVITAQNPDILTVVRIWGEKTLPLDLERL